MTVREMREYLEKYDDSQKIKIIVNGIEDEDGFPIDCIADAELISESQRGEVIIFGEHMFDF